MYLGVLRRRGQILSAPPRTRRKGRWGAPEAPPSPPRRLGFEALEDADTGTQLFAERREHPARAQLQAPKHGSRYRMDGGMAGTTCYYTVR